MKASIKRKLIVGTKIKIIASYSAMPQLAEESKEEINKNKRIGIIRTIDTVQTNAIRFDDKSWLYFPKASDSEETENGFIVYENYGRSVNSLTYEFIN